LKRVLADKDGYFKPDFQNKSNLKIITDNCDNFVGTINTYDYPIISVPKPKTTGIMSLKKIVSTDNMRPVMKGVYIDKNHSFFTYPFLSKLIIYLRHTKSRDENELYSLADKRFSDYKYRTQIIRLALTESIHRVICN